VERYGSTFLKLLESANPIFEKSPFELLYKLPYYLESRTVFVRAHFNPERIFKNSSHQARNVSRFSVHINVRKRWALLFPLSMQGDADER
jgi:hypothetical protein